MPLPAALLQRLQKRGIVPEKEERPAPVAANTGQEEVEEVFAEDYDDIVKEPVSQTQPESSAEIPEPIPEERGPLIHEELACPNRNNPYHKCTDYCKERWGYCTFEATEDMIRKRSRMLTKYPLPEGWEEVADSKTNRYYYWNLITDEVSWLSPSHPSANVTKSAEKMFLEEKILSKDRFGSDDEIDMKSDSDVSLSSSDSDSEEEIVDRRRGRGRDFGNRGRQKREELDPMDPASYSDVGRGSWSTGLDRRGEAKTGADITASGPLFQQRPYPSPGEILRRNQEIKK